MTRDLFLKSFLVIVICAGFLFLQPRTLAFLTNRFGVLSLFTHVKQTYHLNSWLSAATQPSLQFDVPAFWEVRDRYSVGYFMYNAEVFHPYSILEFEEVPRAKNQIFEFTATDVQSKEWLSFIEAATQSAQINPEQIKWTNGHDIIWEDQCNSVRCVHVHTLRNLREMEKHHGLIHFGHSQVKLHPGLWWWVSDTTIFID